MSFFSELEFGAFLVYSPRGQTEISRQSRVVRDQIKLNRMIGDPPRRAALVVARRLADVLESTRLAVLFRAVDTAIPVPRSSPLVQGGLWPAQELALALRAVGLVPRVDPILERVVSVRKSAFSAPGERASPREHFESFSTGQQRTAGGRVLLIDDFVTKGATLMAAAARLRADRPGIDVRAFAAVRTLGLRPEIERIEEPCVGTIRLVNEQAVRKP